MAHGRVDRDTITCGAAISACEEAGQRLLASGLLAAMACGRVQRDTTESRAAISACVRSGMRLQGIQRIHGLLLLVVQDGQWLREAAFTRMTAQVGAQCVTINHSAATSACGRGCQRLRAKEPLGGTGGVCSVCNALGNINCKAAVGSVLVEVSPCLKGGCTPWALELTAYIPHSRGKRCTTHLAATFAGVEGGVWTPGGQCLRTLAMGSRGLPGIAQRRGCPARLWASLATGAVVAVSAPGGRVTWRAVNCKSRSQPQFPSPAVGRARGEQFVCTDARRGGFPTAGVCLTPGLGLHRFSGRMLSRTGVVRLDCIGPLRVGGSLRRSRGALTGAAALMAWVCPH